MATLVQVETPSSSTTAGRLADSASSIRAAAALDPATIGCNSLSACHMCCNGKPFDYFELNDPDVRLKYDPVRTAFETWWRISKPSFNPTTIRRHWRRDIPYPSNFLGIDCNHLCLTMWATFNVVLFFVLFGLWLFLIFGPFEIFDHPTFVTLTIAVPIVASIAAELIAYVIVSFHKNVIQYAVEFFPHLPGLVHARWHNERQVGTHLMLRQVNFLALSNVLILANLVNTKSQRQALQVATAFVFFAALPALSILTTRDRFGSEFFASKLIAQIDEYFRSQGAYDPVSNDLILPPAAHVS